MDLAATQFESTDIDAAVEFCYEQRWTDGLPVIPPTRGAVERIINHVKRDPNEVVGIIAPRDGVATIEAIAINCVMAGCKPEYVPIVIAVIEAICEEKFNLNGVQTTTHSCAPLVMVSGPAVKQLGFNTKECAFGHGCRPSATVGRAVRLVLWNVGTGIPGEPCKTTHGHPGYFSYCVAEDADANPWEGQNVEYGFTKYDTVASVAAVEGPRLAGTGGGYSPAEDVMFLIGDSIATLGANNVAGGDLVVALSPMAAKNLSSAGLTKMDVKQGGINLTKAGLPVMVFVYDNFERAARAQAKGLGVPDLRFYVYPQYTPGPDSLRDEESKASQAATDFAQLFHK